MGTPLLEGGRATFNTMEASTPEDWKIIGSHFGAFAGKLPQRVLAHLSLLEGDCGGFAVDRLTHSLQTATLAHRDGRDEEYVVCAPLHDIGDTLGTWNHADVAAVILRPFVSEENFWMVEKHGIFQGYYFRKAAPGEGGALPATRADLTARPGICNCQPVREKRGP